MNEIFYLSNNQLDMASSLLAGNLSNKGTSNILTMYLLVFNNNINPYQ